MVLLTSPAWVVIRSTYCVILAVLGLVLSLLGMSGVASSDGQVGGVTVYCNYPVCVLIRVDSVLVLD